MALGILLILFVLMSVISVLGLLLMYLVKDEKKKNLIFYVMAVWGMAVAVMGAVSLPSNYVVSQAAAWGLGGLSVIALIVNMAGKKGVGRQGCAPAGYRIGDHRRFEDILLHMRRESMYIADLHIHSHYSRATSRECTPAALDMWARRKGIHITGTGDFTHPGGVRNLMKA